MKLFLKAVWFSILDTWFEWRKLWSSDWLRFKTVSNALSIEICYQGHIKTVRIGVSKLDAAIRSIDRSPHQAYVFREAANWAIVPAFLVPELRKHLVAARDALERSRAGEAVGDLAEADVSGPVETGPKINQRPSNGRLN